MSSLRRTAALFLLTLLVAVASSASKTAASDAGRDLSDAQCTYSFEGSTQGWASQPDNAYGNQSVMAVPSQDYAFDGQYSLKVVFSGVQGAAGMDNPSADLCQPAVVQARVFLPSSAGAVWLQIYALDAAWRWFDTSPGRYVWPRDQWIDLEWDLSQYAGEMSCPLHRLGLQFGHDAGQDTFYLDCVGCATTPTVTPTSSQTSTPGPSSTPTTTPTAPPTATPTQTTSRTPSPSYTATASHTATAAPTNSPTATATSVPSSTLTRTATRAPVLSSTPTPTERTQQCQIFLGAFVEPESSTCLDRSSGKQHGIQKSYSAFMYNGSAAPFPNTWVRATQLAGKTPLIAWEPWDPQITGAVSLQDIVDGKFDAYIDSWAHAARDVGADLLLAFAQEPNLRSTDYPWAGKENAGLYVRAWRHVHSRFDQAGATNVRWVWSINHASSPADNDYESYFPGAEWVDWIGVDGYQWGNKATWGSCASFQGVFGAALSELAAAHPGVPIIIAETAAASDAGCDKAAWIQDTYSSLQQHPQVRAVVWFSTAKYESSTGSWIDWRPWSASTCDTSSSVVCQTCLQAYRDAVASPIFCDTSPYPSSHRIFLPVIQVVPVPASTPTPTHTSTPTVTTTAISTATMITGAFIEDFENGAGDWWNPWEDVDFYSPVADGCHGVKGLGMGGVDEGSSWVGEAILVGGGGVPAILGSTWHSPSVPNVQAFFVAAGHLSPLCWWIGQDTRWNCTGMLINTWPGGVQAGALLLTTWSGSSTFSPCGTRRV